MRCRVYRRVLLGARRGRALAFELRWPIPELLRGFPLYLHALAMGTRKKATVYLDEELLRGVKVLAARTDRKDYEVLEAALRQYLGVEVLERVWSRGDLSDDEAWRPRTGSLTPFAGREASHPAPRSPSSRSSGSRPWSSRTRPRWSASRGTLATTT